MTLLWRMNDVGMNSVNNVGILVIMLLWLVFFNKYSNLPLKYALWTRAVGAHLVGRCVLYSYHFLDPLIWWIATENGSNLRQPAWPKPNHVKSLQSWASRTRWASGRWGQSMKSVKAPSGKPGIIRRTYCKESFVARAYRDVCWIWKCYWLQRLWSSTQHYPRHRRPIALLRCSNGSCQHICMMNIDERLRRFSITLTNWHWMSSLRNTCILGKWLDMTCSNNKVWTLVFVKKIAHLIEMRT